MRKNIFLCFLSNIIRQSKLQYLKYDNENNSWMKMEGGQGEWAIAYHGVARNKTNSEIFSAIDNIVKNNLKEGRNQQYNLTENINLDTKSDYPKCSKGVYLTPKIQIAEIYDGLLMTKNIILSYNSGLILDI